MGSELPANWNEVRLGDCGRWLSGGTPSTKNPDFWDGDIPWISGKSLTTHYLRDSDRRVTTLGAANGTRIAPQGSTLMVVRGMSLQTEFRSGIAMRELAFGQDCKAIIPREGIEPRFLANAVRARAPEILGMVDSSSHGTGRLATELIQALRIGLPPMEEQRAIAEVLASLDDALELCWRSERLIEQVAQAIAEEIEQFGCVQLREVAELRRDSVQPAELLGQVWSHYSIPAFDEGHRPHIDFGDSIASAKFRVAAEAVLVSKLNPAWHRVWLPDTASSANAICSTEFMPLFPLEPFSAASLWSAVLSRQFNSQLRERASGTSGSHQRVRPDDMLACSVMDIRLLSDPQAALLNLLAEDFRLLRLKRDALQATRDELLPKLVSGDLRIDDPRRLLDQVA